MPEDSAGVIADLVRRIEALERSPQLISSSVRDGRLAIVDANGYEQMVIGRLREANPDDGGRYTGPFAEPARYGLAMLEDDGTTIRLLIGDHDDGRGVVLTQDDGSGYLRYLIAATENGGLRAPEWSAGWMRIEVGDQVVVSSGSWTTAWRCAIRSVYHDLVQAYIWVYSDVGTTGEIRVIELVSGYLTDAKAVSSGTNERYELKWEHGLMLDSPNRQFEVQMRLTGGAGILSCRPDSMLNFASTTLLAGVSGGWV